MASGSSPDVESFQLVFTTPGGPWSNPAATDFRNEQRLGQWEELGVSFADSTRSNHRATAVALLCGPRSKSAADFYISIMDR